MTIEAYLDRQMQWSLRTFGDSKRTVGLIEHIKKELEEIRADPDDLIEWCDVIILALDGYWRHGGSPETLMADLQRKQDKNFGRKYIVAVPEDTPTEHER